MKTALKLWTLSAFILLVGMLNGCRTYNEFACYVQGGRVGGTPNYLLIHRSPMVRYPTQAGLLFGECVGFPPSIITATFIVPALPDTAFLTDDRKERIGFFPSVILAAIGEHALGVPCWTLFGWWWPMPKVIQPNPSNEKQTEQPSSGPTKKNTNHQSP